MLEPKFGTLLNPGNKLNIIWVAQTIERINIQLYWKNEYKFTIAENITNIGNFSWEIPLNIPFSNQYIIKIISHKNENIYKFSG